jgi:hypothetical protein
MFNKKVLALLIAGFFLFTGPIISHAENTRLSQDGETGYVPVKDLGLDYIATESGRFLVTKDTKIYNTAAGEIKFRDIQKTCIVDIEYQRIDGQLTATTIFVKFPSEDRPL